MSFINWIVDHLSSEDVIDAYFIISDLVDINLTDEEMCESASFDSLANATANKESDVPIGKRVL